MGVSTRTVKTMPHFLIQSEFYPHDMKAALTQAYLWTQKDLVAHAVSEGWDVQASGSTAVTAVWKGDTVWTAHLGDSRCVIGYEKTKALHHETRDHKPSSPEEKARIDSSGAEVRSRTYPDGVWEFLESEFVVKAVSKKIASDGARMTIQKLHRESRKRWKNEEGDYCDDITSVFVQLR